MEGTENTLWFLVFLLEGIVIITCNIISLIVFSRKVRQSKPRLLLMNQSFADLLVGLESVYYCLKFVSSEFDYMGLSTENNTCLATIYIFNMAVINFVVDLSLASLALIALDRAFAVFKPFRHRALRSKHYYLGIFGIWVLSLVPSSCIPLLRCNNEDTVAKVGFAFSMVTAQGTLLVLVTAYSGVYIKVKYYTVFPNGTNSHARSQIKLSLTLFFASLASMLTISPSTLIIMYCFVRTPSIINSPNNLEEFAVFMTFSNSFINFFIYAWRFPEFVEDMKTFFGCKKRSLNVLSLEMAANMQASTRNIKI